MFSAWTTRGSRSETPPDSRKKIIQNSTLGQGNHVPKKAENASKQPKRIDSIAQSPKAVGSKPNLHPTMGAPSSAEAQGKVGMDKLSREKQDLENDIKKIEKEKEELDDRYEDFKNRAYITSVLEQIEGCNRRLNRAEQDKGMVTTPEGELKRQKYVEELKGKKKKLIKIRNTYNAKTTYHTGHRVDEGDFFHRNRRRKAILDGLVECIRIKKKPLGQLDDNLKHVIEDKIYGIANDELSIQERIYNILICLFSQLQDKRYYNVLVPENCRI